MLSNIVPNFGRLPGAKSVSGNNNQKDNRWEEFKKSSDFKEVIELLAKDNKGYGNIRSTNLKPTMLQYVKVCDRVYSIDPDSTNRPVTEHIHTETKFISLTNEQHKELKAAIEEQKAIDDVKGLPWHENLHNGKQYPLSVGYYRGDYVVTYHEFGIHHDEKGMIKKLTTTPKRNVIVSRETFESLKSDINHMAEWINQESEKCQKGFNERQLSTLLSRPASGAGAAAGGVNTNLIADGTRGIFGYKYDTNNDKYHFVAATISVDKSGVPTHSNVETLAVSKDFYDSHIAEVKSNIKTFKEEEFIKKKQAKAESFLKDSYAYPKERRDLENGTVELTFAPLKWTPEKEVVKLVVSKSFADDKQSDFSSRQIQVTQELENTNLEVFEFLSTQETLLEDSMDTAKKYKEGNPDAKDVWTKFKIAEYLYPKCLSKDGKALIFSERVAYSLQKEISEYTYKSVSYDLPEKLEPEHLSILKEKLDSLEKEREALADHEEYSRSNNTYSGSGSSSSSYSSSSSSSSSYSLYGVSRTEGDARTGWREDARARRETPSWSDRKGYN